MVIIKPKARKREVDERERRQGNKDGGKVKYREQMREVEECRADCGSDESVCLELVMRVEQGGGR